MTTAAVRHIVSICLSKDGDARFMGHRDLARLLERSLRRSGLPVQLTQGFNPRLSLSYTDALPVGMASEGEWTILKLNQDLDPIEVRAMLAPALPEAVRLVDVCKGPPQGVGPVVRYRLEVVGELRSATDALGALLGCPSYSVTDRRRDTTIDIRPFLAGGRADGPDLVVDMVAHGDRPPRPAMLVEALNSIATERGREPPGFGVITKLRMPGRRLGEDETWHDDAGVPAAAAGPPAGCSSTPARAKRAG